MQLLVLGGAGAVGSMIVDRLSREHRVRVADLRQVEFDDAAETVVADVTDVSTLRAAVEGQEAVVYLAMGRRSPWGETGGWAESQFDVNVKGLYLALRTAAEAGIRRAVYASTLSIFDRCYEHGHELEDREPDAVDGYGLTKRLGEEVCRAAARQHDMDIVSLRLCAPLPDPDYLAYAGRRPEIRTAGSDVASAFAAALRYDATGFEPFIVCGDGEQRSITWTRTYERLGWRPELQIAPR